MSITNTWTGIGNVGSNLELRSTNSGHPVTSFSIACDRFRKDTEGNSIKDTDWVPVTVWGKLAERCSSHLSKGKKVAVSGRLMFRSYEKDGVPHKTAEVIASDVKFL